MHTLDETDLEILRLLVEDARRPYSDIAAAVGLSAPTISDRVERMADLGVIERFTLDLDRSLLADGVGVLVTLDVRPGRVGEVRSAVATVDGVEHVFVTASGDVVFQAHLPDGDVDRVLTDAVDESALGEYDVELLVEEEWVPEVGAEAFALECAECGNTVTSEGESLRLDGDVYQFCCGSCRQAFRERYESLRDGAT
ncbi:AsnC family transcriptional regulator [Halobacteriaceae archaeon GCM10025711]